MIIYPAIDLSDGKCVRLYKGDFATTKIYNEDPFSVLAEFEDAGSTWVHIVDLDGAKAGKFMQMELISRLVSNSKLNIEIGGGIRSTEDIKKLLDLGVKRVVVGSIAVSNPQLTNEWMNEFGADKIVLALDCRLDDEGVPRAQTHGWQQENGISIYEVLEHYPNAEYVLCTDVSVDGTLAGPSIALYKQIQSRYPNINIIASGGVGNLSDVVELKKLNLHGIVIGKALYENQFTLKDVLAL